MKESKTKSDSNFNKVLKLEARVKELEKILNIIHSGNIDALVICKEGKTSVATLEGENEPYRLLIESFSDGAVTLSEDGTIIHCNKSFCDLMKNSSEKLIGISFVKYIKKEQQKRFMNLLNQTDIEDFKGQFQLNISDNSTVTVILACQFLRLGNVVGRSIIVTDITELKNLENENNKSKERYKSIMDNASCGIFIHNPKGIILEVNKQMEKILGETRNNLKGKNIKEFVLAEQRQYSDLLLQKLLIEKSIGPSEGHIQDHTTGKIKDVRFSASCIDLENEKIFIGIVDDITEETLLRSQSLLHDKLSTVGVLASGIIHEINNPVTWILANLNYLKKKTHSLLQVDGQQPLSIEKFEQIIDETINGTEKIREIVKNLKGFARTDETGHVKPSNINSILNSAIEMASPQFKDIAKIEQHFAPDLPAVIISASKLQQVFLNLIINAAQSFPEKKDTNIINISTSAENNSIRIDIQDTGCGISADTLPHIFEPFFTTKPSGIGSGIGLSICSDIIHHAGGGIIVNSELGVGTTFTITLPVIVSVESANEPKIIPLTSNKRMLVVADEIGVLNITKQILMNENTITDVIGGRNAISLLKKSCDNFDIIITELSMQEVNGADIYRFVADKYPGKEKSIIFITDQVITSVLANFLKSIDNICLKKPFAEESLLKVVHDLL